MQVQKHSMNWLPKQSTYDYVQAQNAKRHEAHQAFLDSQDSLATSFSSIVTNAAETASTNAANQALTRVTSSNTSSQALQDALDQISSTQTELSSAGIALDGSSNTSSSTDNSVNLLA